MTPVQMNWKMLFRIGVTLVLGVGVILFYLVNVEETDTSENFKEGYSDKYHISYQDIQIKVQTSPPSQKAEASVNDTFLDFLKDAETVPKANSFNEDTTFHDHYLEPVLKSPDPVAGSAVHLCVVVCDKREEEAMVMLKSAAMVTHTTIPLVFHIITEPQHHLFFRDQLNLWPKVYRERVAYRVYTVTFPKSNTTDSWRKLFKPCASQRLFLPDLLKSVDSLIYVDTDTLFLRSTADLWSHFSLFNQTQLAGLVGEAEDATAGWYNRFASHPFYGNFGVNSGVMLMNLTRLRRTRWLSDMQRFYDQYRLNIPWGDQDLINIFFAAHPDQLYLLTCPWNYRSDHCKYMSNCKQAEQDGVSVLHGSRRMFYANHEPAFGAIYETFKNYRLGDDLEFHFLNVLEKSLDSAPPTTCGKLSSIFLMQLQKLKERNSEMHMMMAQI